MATEKRLIDANALVKKATGLLFPSNMEPCGYIPGIVEAVCMSEIYAMPTVDAVEVVRCKDCMCLNRKEGNDAHGHLCTFHSCNRKGHERYLYVEDNDFCSCGVRRENDV